MKEREMGAELVREVALDQWGRALLEELLFRAAEAVPTLPTAASAQRAVEVALTFRITASVQDECLEIRAESAAEAPLVTRLRRPF